MRLTKSKPITPKAAMAIAKKNPPTIQKGALAKILRGETILLKDAILWPELFLACPRLQNVPIIPAQPDERWTSAAVLARITRGKLDPRSKILIYPNRRIFPTKNRLLKSLLHETCHLLQCINRTWNGENLHRETNHKNHPLEKEAKRFGELAGK